MQPNIALLTLYIDIDFSKSLFVGTDHENTIPMQHGLQAGLVDVSGQSVGALNLPRYATMLILTFVVLATNQKFVTNQFYLRKKNFPV